MAAVHEHPGYPVKDYLHKRITILFSFQNILHPTDHQEDSSKSWMCEGGSKAITIKTALVLLHSTCPVLESRCIRRSVCTQFKLTDQYVRAVSGQQLPSSAFGPDLLHQMSKRSLSECFRGGEIVLVKHY